MNLAILREEEDAATEFPSILKLLIKKIKIAGNNPLTRQWWYDVMTSRPPTLPKNEEKYREEILDRVEEGWLEEEWTRTMPHLISELLQKKRVPRYRRNTMDTNGRTRQSPDKQMSSCSRTLKNELYTASRQIKPCEIQIETDRFNCKRVYTKQCMSTHITAR